MAMIQCPECDGKISEHATTCPHCGYPIKPETNKVEYVLVKGERVKTAGPLLLKLLAVLVWIGGVIIAGSESSTVAANSSTSFVIFLSIVTPYIINGIILFGIAKIIEKISFTYDIVDGMRLEKRSPKAQRQADSSKEK